jgi:threonine/homoserine/homoserine lactone efflux protein
MIDVTGLVTYLAVMSITPGPNNVMVTASGATFGYRATLPHILGIGAGAAAQVVLVCLGVGALFDRFPALHPIMAWAGAIYLLYMAWHIIGAKGVDAARSARPVKWWEAAVFQAVNPKAWVMAMTTAAVFFPHSGSVAASSVIVGALFLGINIPCVSAWALFGSSLRKWLLRPGYRQAFNATMGGLLVITAVMGIRS